jgi:hypothetical protein
MLNPGAIFVKSAACREVTQGVYFMVRSLQFSIEEAVGLWLCRIQD